MLYQLAEHLHRGVGELCESMTEDEFRGWVAYFRIKNRRRD